MTNIMLMKYPIFFKGIDKLYLTDEKMHLRLNSDLSHKPMHASNICVYQHNSLTHAHTNSFAHTLIHTHALTHTF